MRLNLKTWGIKQILLYVQCDYFKYNVYKYKNRDEKRLDMCL